MASYRLPFEGDGAFELGERQGADVDCHSAMVVIGLAGKVNGSAGVKSSLPRRFS